MFDYLYGEPKKILETLRPEDEDGNDNENKLGLTVFGCRFSFERAIVKKIKRKQVKYFHFQLQNGKKIRSSKSNFTCAC